MCAFTACPNTGEIVQNGYCVCPIGHLVHNGACTSKSHWFDHGLHNFFQIMNWFQKFQMPSFEQTNQGKSHD